MKEKIHLVGNVMIANLVRLLPKADYSLTRRRLHDLKFKIGNSRLRLIEPVGYLQFLALQKSAKVVITDSGGIQEATTFLGVPCVTVRENTERPITVTMGTNVLVGQDMGRLKREVDCILA